MILYDFTCAEGHVFEAGLASSGSPAPTCRCGAESRRRPSRVNTTGASAGTPREQMPRSWRSVAGGHPDAVAYWHREASRRQKLEERHPELAGDRRPVLAHEGIFAGRPLRAGDDVAAAIAEVRGAAGAGGAGAVDASAPDFPPVSRPAAARPTVPVTTPPRPTVPRPTAPVRSTRGTPS
ncbi:zinc ribbon domain-containing protein [Miniimonas sp. S16]|uniref:zinc ribbon domain-containing protein n=2 Tax=Miniimonas TaxID=947525 RepID=UPI0018FFB65F|nr:zinc ribbon domain-containing protein [Miniimonas sp. S16]